MTQVIAMPQNKQTCVSKLITYAQDMTGTSGEDWMIKRLESESVASTKNLGLLFFTKTDAKHTREN